MTIEKAIHELINEYNRVKDNVGVKKPVNGDKQELYLDAYKKFENKCIPLQ